MRTLYEEETDVNQLLKATHRFCGFIKCIASILWTAYTTALVPNLEHLVTDDLFDSVYRWIVVVQDSGPFRRAIDSLICSMCAIRPEMFQVLLKKMGILMPNMSTDLSASISDDRKDARSTAMDHDDNPQDWYSHLQLQSLDELNLSRVQLLTIAMACQSQLAIRQLIDSGLPTLLTEIVNRFCGPLMAENGISLNDSGSVDMPMDVQDDHGPPPMINVTTVRDIVDFFAEVCSEGMMRDWLGSEKGSRFWKPLLFVLCNSVLLNECYEIETTYSELENSTIRFLSRVTACHPANQEVFTQMLVSVIERPVVQAKLSKQTISGFTRRLILQVLLESESILVAVHSQMSMQKRDFPTGTHFQDHPSKRANAHNNYFLMSTHTKISEILENSTTSYASSLFTTTTDVGASIFNSDELSMLQDANACDSIFSAIADGSGAGSMGGGAGDPTKSGFWKTIANNCLEIDTMDQSPEFLSVAAGVTAKDKRLKDVKNQAAKESLSKYNLLWSIACCSNARLQEPEHLLYHLPL